MDHLLMEQTVIATELGERCPRSPFDRPTAMTAWTWWDMAVTD